MINFENILSVKLFHDDEDNECLYEIYTTVNAPGDNYILLGEYNTEKRAIEILQEIVNVAKEEEFFHIRKSSLNNLDELAEPKYILKPVSRPKVYEMPKE